MIGIESACIALHRVAVSQSQPHWQSGRSAAQAACKVLVIKPSVEGTSVYVHNEQASTRCAGLFRTSAEKTSAEKNFSRNSSRTASLNARRKLRHSAASANRCISYEISCEISYGTANKRTYGFRCVADSEVRLRANRNEKQ